MAILVTMSSALMAQEAESRAVKFRLNNVPDREGPTIQIHAPVMEESDLYKTEKQEVEVIGEVKDASKIRFVSVNNDIKVVDGSGLFASTLTLSPGENEVRVKSMD